MIKRVIFDIILFISIFIFPWWVSFTFLFIGIFTFNKYYEFIIGSIIIYSLFSIPNDKMVSSPIFFASIVSVFYILVQYFKTSIILYKK